MDETKVLVLVIVGLFGLCTICIGALMFVVLRFTNQGEPGQAPAPRRKIFVRPNAASEVPNLVKPPTEKSSVEPMAGPDGITSIDKTGGDQYKPLNELAPAVAMKAVDDFLGRTAVSDAVDQAEAAK